MGGSSLGLGKSRSKNSQQFGQNVWEGNQGALKDLYGGANRMFNGAMGGKNALSKNTGSMLGAQRNLLGGGPYAGMNNAGMLSQSLQQSLNSPTAMQEVNGMIMGGSGNNYADAMKSQYIQDANDVADNMMANIDQRAAASGMSGSSRQGVMQGLGMRDINRNLQRNMANTGFSTFEKDLDRKLQIAQQADQSTLARQGMLQSMLGDQANMMNTGLNYGLQQQQVPFGALNSYTQAVGGPAILSSGAGSGSSKSMGGSVGGK